MWLVRDPTDTFLSNRKMWLAMFERYALWPWEASLLDTFLTQAFALAAECLRRATSLLPRNRLVVVPFDQLTATTLDTLDGLNRRLLMGNWQAMQPALVRTAAGKAGYRPETYQLTLLPTAARSAVAALQSAQDAALSSHGL